jgi:hypothetical protein
VVRPSVALTTILSLICLFFDKIRDSGMAGIWEKLDNNQTYRVGFAVESPVYSRQVLEDIVTEQWPGSFLFKRPVEGNGNWQVLSAIC